MINPIDSNDIRNIIEKKYKPPAYLTLFEVRSVTGFSIRERYADVIVFSMWPSNGLTITGIEIKVTRQDLLHEIKRPEKSRAIKRFCDYWWLCTPLTLRTDGLEIPEDWGVMKFSKQKIVEVKRKAPKLEAEPMTKSFLFSCMRSANRSSIDKVERYIREIR